MVASIHKYWTPTWKKAADDTNLSELVKMAELSTVQSHVLNCKLYKILVENIDECSKVVSSEDVDKLHSKNKILHSKLTLVDKARSGAEYKLIKFEMIQMVCINARKRAEVKLKCAKIWLTLSTRSWLKP
ncbi:hypothetical protein Fot_21710 [Forsythia ovata]|uniref:Uncharacterized protein n=1 Tax=Forsythia ovata TaxID=205694 RepID=A0ABD1UVL4_9LAMI